MTKKQENYFEEFFKEMTNSVSSNNNANTNILDLKQMQKNVAKAEDLNSFLDKTFNTPEARKIWNSLKTKNTKTEEKKEEIKLEIKYFKKENPKTWWFAWVAWMWNLKQELRENFIKPLKFKFLVKDLEKKEKLEKKDEIYKTLYNAYKKFSVSIPTWLLFYGPPGTWKTFITKKLAQELWAWLIQKSVWEFGSSYIHETSKNIKNFFEQAKKASENSPIILFLDEIDSLVSKRTNSVDSNKAEEVSQFLQEFNALEDAPNLIVIAATNRPDHLDSALLRSWRLDKKIYIWAPDFEARKELFQIFIEKEDRPHKDLDYKKLAELTDWYVAADIENICKEVSRDASKNILDLSKNIDAKISLEEVKKEIEKSLITMDLIKQAIKETTPSTKYVDMSIYENWQKNLEK